MTTEVERHFHAEMVSGAARLKREIGYNPTRFIRMVSESGGVAAAHSLLRGNDASDGFTKLWNYGRLALSVEAFVLLPWYQHLFSDDEREVARRRLREHGFDVDQFLASVATARPSWAEGL